MKKTSRLISWIGLVVSSISLLYLIVFQEDYNDSKIIAHKSFFSIILVVFILVFLYNLIKFKPK